MNELMGRVISPPRPTKPYSFVAVEIEINHDCNRACAYCPNSLSERRNQGRMSEELFLRILRQLQQINYEGRISYHFYNEPLLSPDLEHFVGLTRKFLPASWIDIYTNGTLLTKERLLRLLELGTNRFTVTKHHGSKEYAFEKVYKDLPEELQKKIILQSYKDLLLTNRGGLVKAGFFKVKAPLSLPCLVPSYLMVITVNGNVLPCYEDYKEQNVMGNIRETSLLDIWNGEKYSGFRADLKARKRAEHPVCKDCNSARIVM